ncbi:MAG: NusG domain II-containing protein [Fusicatenibacter sp.]|nr:NusG domain II-containing protein [Fusicatenibacter sp.]
MKFQKKRNDILLIFAVLITAGILMLVGNIQKKPGNQVQIKVDGEVFGVYSLSVNQEIKIGNGNVCRISDGQVSMERADCPDQICVKTGAISHTGESIVCLPHRVVIEVIRENPDDSVDDSLPDVIAR